MANEFSQLQRPETEDQKLSRSIAFVVAYDGTDFCGSQRQTNGRSVQGDLEAALSVIFKTPVEVSMSSRTDGGVHATGNVGRFFTNHPILAQNIPFALNQVLERDVRVKSAWETDENFHPRHSARVRTYRYTIDNLAIENPLMRRFVGRVRGALDVEAMQSVCPSFVGVCDFASWQNAGSPPTGGTVRNMTQLEVAPRQDVFGSDVIDITMSANAFLYQMVRNVVGTLIEAGRGKLSAQDVVRLMDAKDRTLCPPPAPSQGLCLTHISFEEAK
ncbi:MAG TPA: tRNA pseudouridine(38-40) synthase TruA [Abditibacteriaceae bacterium]|nr:tRNA pseudouridine(38-40) synthase TruA [Abditibacteriaceae bacterium]